MDSNISNKVNLLYSKFCGILDKIIDEKNKRITINVLSARKVETDLLNVSTINAQDLNGNNINCETISGDNLLVDLVAVDRVLTNKIRTKNFSSKNSNITNINAKNIVCTEISVLSDMRLKKDIEKNIIDLEDIDKLNSYKYKYIESAENVKDDKIHIGLMAQEIEKLYPEAVTNTNGHKVVNYIQLIPIMIEYIKLLKKEIRNKK